MLFFFSFPFLLKGTVLYLFFFFFNLRCELINLILRDSKSNITYITKALMSYCCEYGIFVTTRTIQLLPSIMCKNHVKRYENSYFQTHTLRWLLHSFTTVTHYHSVIKSLMIVQKKKKNPATPLVLCVLTTCS